MFICVLYVCLIVVFVNYRFKTEEEAVAIANATSVGLAGNKMKYKLLLYHHILLKHIYFHTIENLDISA